MAKGVGITLTALKECDHCPVMQNEGAPFGAAFDTTTRQPNWLDLLAASFVGYEPRNGSDQLTTCASHENCGTEKPRQAICFLHRSRVNPIQSDPLIPYQWGIYPV